VGPIFPVIGGGIAGCHFDQTVVCSLFAAEIPLIETSKSLSPAESPNFARKKHIREELRTLIAAWLVTRHAQAKDRVRG
jgi:hypothetical protein